ncbi:sulfatase [Niabella terrae]
MKIKIIISFLLFTVFNKVWVHARPNRKPFNVLLITIDDLRPSLGCYGDAKAITPFMDQLASRGILFNRAYCQQAVCNPSRSSVMTGRRPDDIGVTDLVTHFRKKYPDLVTLPQAFRKAGYIARGIGKIYHGSRNTQDEASWSLPSIQNLSLRSEEYFLPQNQKKGKAAAYEFTPGADDKYPDGKIANELIQALRSFKNSGGPFFLAAGFKKPHLPFNAPQKYLKLYENTAFAPTAFNARPRNAPEIAFHHSQELRGYTDIADSGPLSAQQQEALIKAYYACISFVDAQIGKILDELDRLGLRQQTIVLLWGDHGYHLGEQDLWCKSANFELDTRIPLIISVPGGAHQGTVTPAIVEALDIYPTLLDLCDLPPMTGLGGKSLKPLLNHPRMKWTYPAYSQFGRPYNAITTGRPTHMGYTIRTSDWRYTLWYRLKDGLVESRELYDMRVDSIESLNLAGIRKYRKAERRLGALLNEYRQCHAP